jgi:glycosyltransferase involved in cell wall biosynthesis
MNGNKVSIIIPTYKRCEMLIRAIDSVLNQTYKNIEVIIVDDNNPISEFRKNTEKIMEVYENDNRVLYLKHDRNKNGAAARNTGVAHSSGDIISFLDDDDWFLKNKIELQLEYLLKNKNFKGVYCGTKIKGKIIIPRLEGDLTKQLLLMETSLYTPTLMFYKSVYIELNGFNESFRRHQDYEFLLRFFNKYKIGVVKECLVFLGDNNGENELKGAELESMKKMFLKTFEFEINAYGNLFKKRVLGKHNALIFLNHLKNKLFLKSLNVMIENLFTNPFYFTLNILEGIYQNIKYRLYIKNHV